MDLGRAPGGAYPRDDESLTNQQANQPMSKIEKHGTGYYSIEGVHYRGYMTENGQRLVPPDITVIALKRPGDVNVNLDPVTVLRVLEQHCEEFDHPAASQIADAIAALTSQPFAAAPNELLRGVSPDSGAPQKRSHKKKPQPAAAA